MIAIAHFSAIGTVLIVMQYHRPADFMQAATGSDLDADCYAHFNLAGLCL